mmetsp:Transcript_5761/g.14388  ORF Transcript_5761/g.14388 Transcript_5761/m.14388 type:complete len:259 (-) Transcript_5761:728-1504(-)
MACEPKPSTQPDNEGMASVENESSSKMASLRRPNSSENRWASSQSMERSSDNGAASIMDVPSRASSIASATASSNMTWGSTHSVPFAADSSTFIGGSSIASSSPLSSCRSRPSRSEADGGSESLSNSSASEESKPASDSPAVSFSSALFRAIAFRMKSSLDIFSSCAPSLSTISYSTFQTLLRPRPSSDDVSLERESKTGPRSFARHRPLSRTKTSTNLHETQSTPLSSSYTAVFVHTPSGTTHGGHTARILSSPTTR